MKWKDLYLVERLYRKAQLDVCVHDLYFKKGLTEKEILKEIRNSARRLVKEMTEELKQYDKKEKRRA